MLPFPINGIPDGYDVAQHLRFAAAYLDGMRNGVFIPGWAPVDNFGFGSVGIRFYPPLADYLLAFTQYLTDDWYTSLWTNSFFWLFPGCIGVYYWSKTFLPRPNSACAALLYAVMPYHLLQIYQFQLFSEFAAAAILPSCFLFATRIIRGGTYRDVFWLAISFSMLILTHIPSTLIGSVALGLYCSVLIDWRNGRDKIARLFMAVGMSMLATMFYWLRLATEVSWVKHDTEQYSSGFYDYRRHFFPLIYNFGDWYWQRLLWLLDIPIILTFFFILPLVIYTVFIRKSHAISPSQRRLYIALSVTGMFLTFMMTSASSLIWGLVGTLQKLQFPWRMLAAGSLIASLSFTVAISALMERLNNGKRLLFYSVAALILAISLFDLTQTILMAAPLSKDKFQELMVDKRADEGCSCWWPTWADKNAFLDRQQVTSFDRNISVSEWKGEDRVLIADAGVPQDIRIATFWYPYWKADVNGRKVELGKDEDGTILVPITDQPSVVRLYFEEPILLQVAKYLSLAGWLILLGALATSYYRRERDFIQTSLD